MQAARTNGFCDRIGAQSTCRGNLRDTSSFISLLDSVKNSGVDCRAPSFPLGIEPGWSFFTVQLCIPLHGYQRQSECLRNPCLLYIPVDDKLAGNHPEGAQVVLVGMNTGICPLKYVTRPSFFTKAIPGQVGSPFGE